MIAKISHADIEFNVDLSTPIDISIPMKATEENMKAWYLDPLSIEPVKGDGFVGAVKSGGAVNFRTINFNPHGHGTHTECLGHITEEVYSVNKNITTFFFTAELVTFNPENLNGDRVITLTQLEEKLRDKTPEAIIIRTLPNTDEKLTRQYSATNPAYISEDVALELRKRNVKHILIDTPSVDREEDGGKLLAHHAFWNVPESPRFDCSITELIYVPNSIEDGFYLLNIGFASFENDASPCKPVLYKPT
ncbi:MAG: cyclase family protein [Salibacteraceae bacterium]